MDLRDAGRPAGLQRLPIAAIAAIVFRLFAGVLFVHALPLQWRARKTNLLLASYLFYAAWNPAFVLLLMMSTVVDWHVAKRIHTAADQPALCIGVECLPPQAESELVRTFWTQDGT